MSTPKPDAATKPAVSNLSTEKPADGFKAQTPEAKRKWLEQHASPDAPDVALWDIYSSNKTMNANLKLVRDALDGVRTNIVNKQLDKGSAKETAVNAIFDTLTVALKAYARAVYNAAKDLDDTGGFQSHQSTPDLQDPDAEVDDTSPKALKTQLLSVLSLVESAAPFLQKRNSRLGITYAELINTIVEALGELLVELVFTTKPDKTNTAALNITSTVEVNEQQIDTTMPTMFKSLQDQVDDNLAKSTADLDLTPVEG
ncbi:uncharacterized protein IL334_007926 [Kwoniella shivajii]|uniref:Uncharacterized protein n=1 Tax=Kwoniella shivajii TaxID=564305 RepID=A0ABZ1DA12_9TREE|nr:hypothetical protein IL334_007926 [Kwoniella shivajii]